MLSLSRMAIYDPCPGGEVLVPGGRKTLSDIGGWLKRVVGLAMAATAVIWLGYAAPRRVAAPSEDRVAATAQPAGVADSAAASVAPMMGPLSSPTPMIVPTVAALASLTPEPAAANTPYLSPNSMLPTSMPLLQVTPTASPTLPVAGASSTLLLDASTCSPPVAQTHFWLSRPIAPKANDWVSTFYLYGSTAGGQYSVHHGVEFVNPEGTLVMAVSTGTVFYAGDDHTRVFGPRPVFYGRLVVIRMEQEYHGQPLFALYGHLSSVAVQEGQPVVAGQVLGKVGATGIAMGPHLHFEVRAANPKGYNTTRNPELWIQPHPGRGVIAGRVVDEAGHPVPGARVVLSSADNAKDAPREAWTYAGPGVNPDEEWFENLVLGDVPAGQWDVTVSLSGSRLRQRVVVRSGEMSWVCLCPPNRAEQTTP